MQANHNIGYRCIYKIIKSRLGNSKKSKKHMYAGREYSNAMWHVDLKDPRFAGIHLVTYLDDSSRCIMAARLFTHASFPDSTRNFSGRGQIKGR